MDSLEIGGTEGSFRISGTGCSSQENKHIRFDREEFRITPHSPPNTIITGLSLQLTAAPFLLVWVLPQIACKGRSQKRQQVNSYRANAIAVTNFEFDPIVSDLLSSPRFRLCAWVQNVTIQQSPAATGLSSDDYVYTVVM